MSKRHCKEATYLYTLLTKSNIPSKGFLDIQWAKSGEPILYFLSPTLCAASFLKYKGSKEPHIRKVIKTLNSLYLFLAIVTLTTLLVFDIFSGFDIQKGFISNIFFFFLFYYSFSRVIEILVAFSRDVYNQLSPAKSSSNLKYYERISLAVNSYLELIILYGFIYFILNLYNFYDCKLDGLNNNSSQVWESLYYSGVTIMTLGYGDIKPVGVAPQFFSLMEVLNGFALIIVSFTVYVSRSIQRNESGEKND